MAISQLTAANTVPQMMSTVNAASAAINLWDATATNVASASTTNIGTAGVARVNITGTTTITSFGTSANRVVFVKFTGALVLTHNATSLILPTGANITTAAGDWAIFASDASGNWACLAYQRVSGLPLSISITASDISAAVLAALAFGPFTNLASASTATLASVATVGVNITGTTTITSFGTGANLLRAVKFASALTLTHNATSLILPTGANIATAAGDVAIMMSDASSNWTCISYQRASGKALSLSSGDVTTALGFTPQTALGFTPVQQGTGVGQSSNTVKMGWSGTRVKVTIDSTDMGNVLFDGHIGSSIQAYSANLTSWAGIAPSAKQDALNYTPLNKAGDTMTGVFYSYAKNGIVGGGDSGCARFQNSSGTGDSSTALVSFLCQGVYGINMHLRADGYFGIGGWSRGSWSWYSDPSGNMVAAGNVTAYSDPKLKEDWEVILDPWAIVDRIDGGRFRWKHGFAHTAIKAGKWDFGILADQVEKVMPEIVTESIDIEGESFKTVDYTKLVPVLLETVKDLNQRLKKLEGRL